MCCCAINNLRTHCTLTCFECCLKYWELCINERASVCRYTLSVAWRMLWRRWRSRHCVITGWHWLVRQLAISRQWHPSETPSMTSYSSGSNDCSNRLPLLHHSTSPSDTTVGCALIVRLVHWICLIDYYYGHARNVDRNCCWIIFTLSPPFPLRLYTLPYWSNPPFLISDIRVLWHSGLSTRAPECQKLKMMG